MTDQSLELQPFEPSDFARLKGWISDEESLMLWSGPFFTHPLDDAQLHAYWLSGQQTPPVRYIYKAVLQPQSLVVGHIELNNIDWRNRAASVSKVLIGDSAWRGKGIASRMVRLLVDFAFEELHLHRLELKVFDFNEPAIHCYQNLGFKVEGHLRDYRKVEGGYWSSYLMSLLEDEWRAANITKNCPAA